MRRLATLAAAVAFAGGASCMVRGLSVNWWLVAYGFALVYGSVAYLTQ
jgi:endonuclease YncB( thermonuclease family)